eukprot:2164858-Pyramimonas_sp.AAC.1
MGAGFDCTEANKRKKLERRASALPELEAQDIQKAPAVFSAYGRRRLDVARTLNQAARRAAQRRGWPLLRRPA